MKGHAKRRRVGEKEELRGKPKKEEGENVDSGLGREERKARTKKKKRELDRSTKRRRRDET